MEKKRAKFTMDALNFETNEALPGFDITYIKLGQNCPYIVTVLRHSASSSEYMLYFFRIEEETTVPDETTSYRSYFGIEHPPHEEVPHGLGPMPRAQAEDILDTVIKRGHAAAQDNLKNITLDDLQFRTWEANPRLDVAEVN